MNRCNQQTRVRDTSTFTDLTIAVQLPPNKVNIMAADGLGVPDSSLDRILNVQIRQVLAFLDR